MKCKKCGKDFENIGLLRKHQREHDLNEKFEVPKKEIEIDPDESVDTRIVIPKDMVYEFQYLSNGQPARLSCLGHMESRGFVIDEFEYNR